MNATASFPMVQDDPSVFRLAKRVYTDPDVFDIEMDRFFEQSWVYVGHESEIPNPGDFRTSQISRHAVLLVRQDDGTLACMFNRCRHRALSVTRDECGSVDTFRCPYHGWIYARSGKLIGVADRTTGYPLDRGKDLGLDGLSHVADVDSYQGLIFATMNPDGPPLAEHLGSVRTYIDLWVQASPDGRIYLARPFRYRYQGNWKLQLENSVDGWHARYVHESALNTTSKYGTNQLKTVERGISAGFDEGHMMLTRPTVAVSTNEELYEEYASAIGAAYGEDRVTEILQGRHIAIAPNVVLMDGCVRVVQPVSVDETLVYSHFVRLGGVSPELNRWRLRIEQKSRGVAGLFNTDDVEMLHGAQSGVEAGNDEDGWLDISRGQTSERRVGSMIVGEDNHEVPFRSFYRRWSELCESEVASSAALAAAEQTR